MADVLTQAQIDEMLKNVAAGAVPEVTQKEEEKVKEYDFRAPKKFTKEQIKVLDGIFEHYADQLTMRDFSRRTSQVCSDCTAAFRW